MFRMFLSIFFRIIYENPHPIIISSFRPEYVLPNC